MTRQDFLRQISLGAAFVLTVPCLHSCHKDESTDEEPSTPHPGSGPIDFTIDISEARFTDAFASRGYVIVDRVVIAQLSGGGYAAASQVCSHFSTELVIYEPTVDEWHCLSHGARFQRSSGVPTNTVTKRNLRLYPTTLNGSMLSVRG